MINSLKALGNIIKTAFIGWDRDNVPRLGAALAYYTLFALAPLLIIAIAVAGIAFGAEAARGEVVSQIDSLIGKNGAQAVQALLQQAQQPTHSVPATILG